MLFRSLTPSGLLVAGRFVDKVGTRIGYMVVMGLWSLSAMGHALANTVMEFGIARFCLGVGESGNFPAAIKTVAEWFPQSERSLATGIFNCGANVGAILAPLVVPWVAAALWLARGLSRRPESSARRGCLLWFLNYRKPAEHPSASPPPSCATSTRMLSETSGPSTPWIQLLGYRQTWAFALGKFLTDPIWWFYLVLAAVLLHPASSTSISSQPGIAADHCL